MSLETENRPIAPAFNTQEMPIEECDQSVALMCNHYGVERRNFEEKLHDGYTKVEFGRSPVGFATKRGHYIVAFAAFSKEDDPSVSILHVIKECDSFGSYSHGLEEKELSLKEYKKFINRFQLQLHGEDLNNFIERFSWSENSPQGLEKTLSSLWRE